MTDLIDRLRAALDQAQTLAEGASSSPGAGEWRVAPSGNLVEGPYVLIDAATSPGIGSWHFAFFAAWCPARVLRLIASHRQLLDAFMAAEDAFNDATSLLSEGIRLPRYHRMATLRAEVDRVAEFWLGGSTE